MATTIRKFPYSISRTPTFVATWLLHVSSSIKIIDTSARSNTLVLQRDYSTQPTITKPTITSPPKVFDKMSFDPVPGDSLFVSEPNPSLFGNGANEPSNPDWTNKNWLKSRFHFSFAEYNDPKRCVYPTRLSFLSHVRLCESSHVLRLALIIFHS